MDKKVYSPKQFGELIGRSVVTLQRWDRKGILKAKRSPTNRRYYTHEQYLHYHGLDTDAERTLDGNSLHQTSNDIQEHPSPAM